MRRLGESFILVNKPGPNRVLGTADRHVFDHGRTADANRAAKV
jgi:hypothetical protein